MQWDVVPGLHPVTEALRAGRPVKRLLVAQGRHDARLEEVLALARQQGVGVERVPRERLDDLYAGPHQGVVALLPPQGIATLDDALALAAQRGEEPFLIALDQVQDPHNVGAVARTAEAAGAHGLLLHERRSAALTPAVHKASAGASQRLPLVVLPNLATGLREAKRRGLWVGGAAADQGQPHYEAKLTGPLVLVLGSEAEGMRRLTSELCDFMVRVPMAGQVASLNVSAAAAVLCFERLRQQAQPAEAKGKGSPPTS